MVDKIKPERMRPEDYAPGESPMRRRVTYVRKEIVSKGVGFGSALAIAISFTTHKSILWAIIHGFFSWLYVIYYALTR
ncbi:hypothetical protein [Parasphingorhabdus sp.]|jgi:hypothetical protein|uniref:hypothetical protein n=1 Tax=Parasphingorhabdus sp. TaxID=2709688 RepID=UPI001B715E76|nr:hypothetical protein [Parasphingorhabdus sp.]MBQ0770201.1 hypothetical protein [Sphingomonadales bacterium]|tara:strand:+ start:620 stop:853 length:234 start_codon:yes stop_codon:yes gene_type:complete